MGIRTHADRRVPASLRRHVVVAASPGGPASGRGLVAPQRPRQPVHRSRLRPAASRRRHRGQHGQQGRRLRQRPHGALLRRLKMEPVDRRRWCTRQEMDTVVLSSTEGRYNPLRFDVDSRTARNGGLVWTALIDAGRATQPAGLSAGYLAALLGEFDRALTPREIVRAFTRTLAVHGGRPGEPDADGHPLQQASEGHPGPAPGLTRGWLRPWRRAGTHRRRRSTPPGLVDLGGRSVRRRGAL